MLEERIVPASELGSLVQAWLARTNDGRATIALEQQADGRVRVILMPAIEPSLLARVQVTMAKYHEALMNLA